MSYLGRKDLNLIFSAVSRVWCRTDRYKHIKHSFRTIDEGPRGKWWYPCSTCGDDFRETEVELDHIDPVVPLNKRQDEMTLLEYIERKYLCSVNNFQILCKPCHREKTKKENATRTERIKNREKIKY